MIGSKDWENYTIKQFIEKRKTPRGWIQIGESRWELARETREGFSPGRILTTPWVRDSRSESIPSGSHTQ